MEKFRVYVAEKSYADYSRETRIVESAGGRLLFARCASEEDVAVQCRDAHGLLLRQTPVGARALDALENLKVISRYGTGCDNVDVDAATRRGVVVTIVPRYCAGEVADHTAALLLAAIRRLPLRDRMVRAGGWDLGSRHPVHRTDGRTLGFVGFGANAREARRRLSGFPFRFAAFDPFVPRSVFIEEKTAALGFRTLLAVSHYVSVHVPLNDRTRGLFDLDAFRAMRRDAVIVNTSRGGVVDEDALAAALMEGSIAGAALDVFRDEPFDPASPLARLDSVILSDHAAWYSEESLEELQSRAAGEAVRVLVGEMPEHPVNPEAFRPVPIPAARSDPRARPTGCRPDRCSFP